MKITFKKKIGKKRVYDLCVKDNHNFIANGVVAHNSGARNFAMEAKPENIEELAALTAIYRPGPLKANVHKKYVNAKQDKDNITYGHPIIEEILGPTFGFITFQEQFMLLAQKLAGFNPGESDKLRKTLVKKSLDTLHSKGSEKDIAREKFIKGSKELNGIPESVSSKLWADIEFFSLYGFNKSHAVSYAIDSYYAAWLHTHYETEWLATILQTANGNPKEMAKVISEIKSFGYDIAPVDINHSGIEWAYAEDLSAFVPPLTSLKGVGDKAVDEIFANRPYKNLDDLFFNEDGKWKHSKLNKTAFDSLCKMEAFNSMETFKLGFFQNHRQLHELVIENYVTLKKGRWGITKTQYNRLVKSGEDPIPLLDELIPGVLKLEDWSRSEKIQNFMTLSNDASADLLFPDTFLKRVKEKGMSSVFEIPSGEKGIGWFCILDVVKKKTKNNKPFMRLKVSDADSNTGWIRVWGDIASDIKYTLWLAEVKNDPNWGMQAQLSKMKLIDAFE